MRLAPLLFAVSLPLCPAVPTATIQVIHPLAFGGLLVQPFGGRITLTASGSLLPEGPGVLPGAAPPAAFARIRLRGPANGSFQLRLDPAHPVLRGFAGGTLTLAAFQANTGTLDGRFDGSGAAEVALGGTLDLPAGAPAGVFSGMVNLLLNVDRSPVVTQIMAVTCTVRSPLTLTNLAALDFAGLTAGRGGPFRVRAEGGHTEGGDGPRLVKGTPHPAAFRLTGPAHTPYTVLLPAEALLTGPGGTLKVVDFTSDQRQGFLPSEGLTFHVGAALQVPAGQPRGTYQGTFQVCVAYH